METDSSHRMVMFLIKLGQWIMSRKFLIERTMKFNKMKKELKMNMDEAEE
jgi:hypothetical protein